MQGSIGIPASQHLAAIAKCKTLLFTENIQIITTLHRSVTAQQNKASLRVERECGAFQYTPAIVFIRHTIKTINPRGSTANTPRSGLHPQTSVCDSPFTSCYIKVWLIFHGTLPIHFHTCHMMPWHLPVSKNVNPELTLFLASLPKTDRPSVMQFVSNLYMKLHKKRGLQSSYTR